MKRHKKWLSLLLTSVLLISCFPTSVNADYHYAETVAAGSTLTESDFSMYCSAATTFTNNGTVTLSGDFNLMKNATFVNNGSFTFNGSDSTFSLFDSCSFVNSGTATITGCYNFGAQSSFTNTGTLYLDNISNANLDGFHNTGKIVCGNGISSAIIDRLKAKTSGSGTIEYPGGVSAPATKTKYDITYDLNGGNWNTQPGNDIFSYYYDSQNNDAYYKIGFDAPFDTLNSNLSREHYTFAGWTCDKDSSTDPTPYLDIFTQWQSNITLTAHWRPSSYYVFYRLDGGTFNTNTTTPEIKNDGTNTFSLFNIESETFTLPTPEKPGYDFGGWILGGTASEFASVTIPKGTTGNRSYTAKWIPKGNTPYTVNVYYMDENGAYPATANISRKETGKTDESITLPASSYLKEGFTFDESRSTVKGTISGDGSLVLSLYYERNQYDITFKSYDGSKTLYSYKGYHGTNIEFHGATPTITEKDYIYHFLGWAKEANSQYPINDLGTATNAKTFYAAFTKEPTFCLITFKNTTGFSPLQNTTFKVNKGEDFNINLYLANDNYYVGTNDWTLTFGQLHVADNNEKGLILGTDFHYSFNGYGKPVVFSIPNVTKDLTITFTASYHENHDYDIEKDVIQTTATCTNEGAVFRYCYMCGKTELETLALNPYNHTNLVNVKAKAATSSTEGNIEYWYCKDCNTYFSDNAGTKEITKADTLIAKLPPEIIEGRNQKVTAGKTQTLSFRSNAEFSEFIRVELDGKTLDPKHYTVKEGSTIVTLNAPFVATLSAGKHTISIVSESGTATTDFTVITTKSSSPATGDSNLILLWIALLFVSASSFIGLYTRKKTIL